MILKLQMVLGAMLSGVLLATSCVGVQAAAEEQTTALAAADPDETLGTKSVANVTCVLAEKPGKDGLVTAKDGSVSYLDGGKALTGLFSVTPDYVKGDLDSNGAPDASDAARILMASAEAAADNKKAEELLAASSEDISTDYQALQLADINGDKNIDSADGADLLIYAARNGAGDVQKPLGYALYYANSKGVLQKGWIEDGDVTYYGNEDYSLSCGWKEVEGKEYYFAENGTLMNTGLTEIVGKTYYFDQTASFLKDSWCDIDGAMHYFGSDGVMETGLQNINGKLYYLDADGAMQVGWITTEDGKRLTTDNGSLVLGWYEQDDDTTFYFDENTGLMATGWYDIDGKTFYFNEDGSQVTSEAEIDGKTCKFREDGSYVSVKICIDAGHYAKYNHSPVNSAYWESDFTWKHHLYLVDALEEYGIEVITTREDKEIDMDLEERGRCSEGCDLFLSVHSNACSDTSVDGPLACCMIDGSTDVLGQQLADTVAEVMQTRQGGSIWKRRGVKFPDLDYYGVLRGAKQVGTPGILLEHSYHTNLRATYWLMDDQNLKRMAAAEAKTIAEYFEIA